MNELEVTENGKLWAVFSYAGFFLGFPVGIIPLLQRDDAYALAHAKHAVAVYIAFMVAFLGVFILAMPAFFCTFGMSNFVLIPVMFLMMAWPFAVTVHGLVLTINGEWGEPIGAFGLGERMFGSLTVKEPEDHDGDAP